MPRYFFHVHDGEDRPDHEGTELSSLNEARNKAVVAAGEELKDLNGRFWESTNWRLWVTDDACATVCALRFSAESEAL